MNQQIGQLFFIGLEGTELQSHEADFIVKNNIGGVILFARNVESPEQVHKLTSDVHALSQRLPEKSPMLIGVDNEGGRVQRMTAPFTQWPPLASLGKLDSTSLAFKFASAQAAELRSVGINLNFSPCVDVLTNPTNEVIGDRALGEDPELVAKVASALVRGFIKGGILPCAKHFPGHGNTTVDSHEELPVEEADMAQLNQRELVPFKKVFRARLDLVMTAHIQFPKIDPDWPVTLSEIFLQKILRDELRFRNILLSDDLDMKALKNNYDKAEIPVRALKAGCDVLLYCNEADSPPIALEAVTKAIETGGLDKTRLQESYNKVMELKKSKLTSDPVMAMEEATRVIGHPDHLRLAKAVASGEIPDDLVGT